MNFIEFQNKIRTMKSETHFTAALKLNEAPQPSFDVDVNNHHTHPVSSGFHIHIPFNRLSKTAESAATIPCNSSYACYSIGHSLHMLLHLQLRYTRRF